jgi:protein-disulfide isomerase
MTYGGDGRLTKNERREAAREKARVLREQHRKVEKRNRALLQGGLVLGSVAIVAIVAVLIFNGAKPAGAGPLNMLSDGLKIGKDFKATPTAALAAGSDPIPFTTPANSATVDIRVYVDYICPFCQAFEAANNPQIETWLKSGAATLEIHPIAALNASSQGTFYSTRAANAAACVANFSPDSFWAVNKALFVNQPKEGTTGLTDDELIKVLTDAGAGNMDKISPCVKDQTFKAWVTAATDRALAGPLPAAKITDPANDKVKGTPTILVNGMLYGGAGDDANAFAAFVVQAAGASFNANPTASPTPTATPSPTATPKK